MKRLMILVAVVGLVGCSKKKEDAGTQVASGAASGTASGSAAATGGTAASAAPTEADCDTLGAKTAGMSMAETPAGTPPDRVAKLKEISDEAGRAIATLCKNDGWSAEAVACGLAAKDPGRECNDKLTDTQKTKMQAQVMAIFAKAAPP